MQFLNCKEQTSINSGSTDAIALKAVNANDLQVIVIKVKENSGKHGMKIKY